MSQDTKKAKSYFARYPWKRSYYTAQQRCNSTASSNHRNYGGKGIKFLMTVKDFEFLWYRDRAYEMKRPSIDRINNDCDYVLENCRYLELSENIGKNRRKPVVQISKQGAIIAEFKSQVEATKKLGIDEGSLSKCLSGKRKMVGGYLWKHA
jgi:hypothetical protein